MKTTNRSTLIFLAFVLAVATKTEAVKSKRKKIRGDYFNRDRIDRKLDVIIQVPTTEPSMAPTMIPTSKKIKCTLTDKNGETKNDENGNPVIGEQTKSGKKCKEIKKKEKSTKGEEKENDTNDAADVEGRTGDVPNGIQEGVTSGSKCEDFYGSIAAALGSVLVYYHIAF